MPLYEYTCPKGHTFEELVRGNAENVDQTNCPNCGAKATRQTSIPRGFDLKGSGFFKPGATSFKGNKD